MQLNALATELAGIVGTIDPSAQAVGTLTSGWIDASKFQRFMAVVQTGVLGAAATLDAKLEQATDGAGTGAKDVTGKAITQIVKATGDNKQAVINLNPSEDLDFDNNFDFFRLSMTVAAAASQTSAALVGVHARQGIASDSDDADVVQIVA